MMMNCIESFTAQQPKSRLNESGDSEYLIKQERKKRSEKFLFTFVAQQAQMAFRSSSSKESPLKIELKYLRRQLHVFKFVWILNIIDSEFEIVTQAATSHRVVFYFSFLDSPRNHTADNSQPSPATQQQRANNCCVFEYSRIRIDS